jgi:bidirectional [NiFe] hydrogenase diaphorase subunit
MKAQPNLQLGAPSALKPPSDDKRWRIVAATMRRHGHAQSALIETLHSIQSCFGYLDEASLAFVAHSLRVPLSKVYGVATFYSLFRLKPQGKHTCVVCMGTACYIKGGPKLLATLDQKFALHVGDTTVDNKVSLLEARCLGACGIAPAGIFDGQVLGNLTSEIIDLRLKSWLAEPE